VHIIIYGLVYIKNFIFTLVLDVFISTGAPELIPFFSPARHCVSFNMVIVLYVLQAFLF